MNIIFDTNADSVSHNPQWRMIIQFMDDHNKLQQTILSISRRNFKLMDDAKIEVKHIIELLKEGKFEFSNEEVKPLFHPREREPRADIFK